MFRFLGVGGTRYVSGSCHANRMVATSPSDWVANGRSWDSALGSLLSTTPARSIRSCLRRAGMESLGTLFARQWCHTRKAAHWRTPASQRLETHDTRRLGPLFVFCVGAAWVHPRHLLQQYIHVVGPLLVDGCPARRAGARRRTFYLLRGDGAPCHKCFSVTPSRPNAENELTVPGRATGHRPVLIHVAGHAGAATAYDAFKR